MGKDKGKGKTKGKRLTGRNRPTSLNRIRAAEKSRQALELRTAGFTLVQIANQLGYRTHSAAHAAIVRALAEVPRQAAEEYRDMQLVACEKMRTNLYRGAVNGGIKEVHALIKVLQHEAKLRGLEAPVKLAGPDGGPLEVALKGLSKADLALIASLGDLAKDIGDG
jgi:AraC-like DNA-binding protein